MKIKKGDNVIVIAGKDKGKTGKVELTMPKVDQVIIDGVNVQTRHTKNKRVRSRGQIIEKSAPIHVSNVAIIEDKKPVRVGYKVEDGKKIRVSRKTGSKI